MTSPIAEIFDLIMDGARRMSARRAAFAARGTELVNTYRHGPYKLVVLFRTDVSSFWEVTAQASRDESWTQDALEAWLDEELGRQLDAWWEARAESP